MNRPLIFTIVILLFVHFSSFGQKIKLKKGENYYQAYSYSESIEKYEGITDKTTEINRRLAESYYNIGKFKKSEKYYETIMLSEEKTTEDIYNYASVLAINKKYKESEKWMAEFNKLAQNDSRGKLWAENKGFYEGLQKDKGRFVIKNLSINAEHEDFGPAYYKDKIVFASSRQPVKMIKRHWNWNELPFLDIYIADVDTNMQLKSLQKFHKSYNKKYHEGPASFSSDGNFMAFTRNNYQEKSEEGIIKLQLFTAEFIEGEWQKEKPMHFNSSEYSVGHASLTEDGKTMYFASDMPGGIGGVDIYICQKKMDGGWTEPVNLGEKINTEGDEMFPFIHPEGILFFASNGLLGLGGLDIFLSRVTENGFLNLENIGVPVNSSYDDFAFILDEKQESGYFSSNRIDGKGDDDIYMFRLLRPFTFGKLIRGTATDSLENILSNVKVSLYNDSDIVIETQITKEDGKYEFEAEQDKYYSLDGIKLEYTNGKNTADTHTEEYIVIADLELNKWPKFSLYCIIKDENTQLPLDSVKVTLTDNINHNDEIIMTTGSGHFFRKLEGRKINDSLSYQLKLERKGYLTESFSYNQLIYRPGQYNMHEDLNIVMNAIEVGMDLSKIIDINPIYFDLNKSNIRPDAAIELDKIVKVMNENQTMVIELGSHTDCRASAAYNRSLSDRRAKSSAKYVRERISYPDRIFGKGYGESKLINHCACEGSRKVPCTEKEHQENRRTEFKIIKM